MTLKKLLHNKAFKLSLFIFLPSLLIIFSLYFFVFHNPPIWTIAAFFYDSYLNLAEFITNKILIIANAEVYLKNHEIIFKNATGYTTESAQMITNWTSYVMFKKWSIIVLIAIWLIPGSLVKKFIFSGVLGVVHFISLISGLLIITLVGPLIVDTSTMSQLYPNIVGELLMITIIVIWVKINLSRIQWLLDKTKLNLNLSNRKLNELIVIVYVFSLLNNFIIPYFNFNWYVHSLLNITKYFVSLFGYESVIDGPYLIGIGGTLFMAKWCLGFLTMFVFASLIYITGKNKMEKWIFIITGVIFLHIINIIRLSILFVFVQNNDDSQLARNHHDIYNLVFYAIIFMLWIIWFEKFALKKSKIKKA